MQQPNNFTMQILLCPTVCIKKKYVQVKPASEIIRHHEAEI